MNDFPNDFVLRVYDTVADQSKWESVLDELAESLNARGCLVFDIEDAEYLKVPFHSSWYDAKVLANYLEKYRMAELSDHDVFLRQCSRDDRAEIVADDVLYHDLDEFRSRPNVEHVLEYGILHRAACMLNKDNMNLSRFSVQFRSNRGGISSDERNYLNILLPHISKAMELGRPAKQLIDKHRDLLSSMDRLSIAICLLDAKGRVVASNLEFRRQLDLYPVFSVLPSGMLELVGADNQRRFEDLKANVRNHGRFGSRPRKEAITTRGNGFLCVELVPLNSMEEIGSKEFNGYALYSVDTSLPIRFDAGPLKLAFGLTNTESDLLSMLARGLTNTQIAEIRDRSVATINVQVKSILAKTDSSSRTQLVRLMMSYGASYLSD